ncbi:MAG: hypothetical protein AAFV53_40690 [Myxococcota bacterium]
MRAASLPALLILLVPQNAIASTCSGLTTNTEKIACLLEAVETLTTENAELCDRLSAVEGDYAATSAVVNLRNRVATVEDELATVSTDYVTSDDLSVYALDAGLSDAEAAISAIEADYLTSSDVAVDDLSDLLGYLSVDTENNMVMFSGANVYIQSGEGSTDDNCDFYDESTETYGSPCDAELTGLGNLIIGYNEDYSGTRDRSGSHNLVIGADHSYASYGGMVVGFQNTISAQYASVSAGRENTASADFSVVHGGAGNTARSSYSAVNGGSDNVAWGSLAVVNGGAYNTAMNDYAVVSGGYENTAEGYASAVLGGYQNRAEGTVSAVSGGYQNAATGDFSTVYAGSSNTAADEKGYAP